MGECEAGMLVYSSSNMNNISQRTLSRNFDVGHSGHYVNVWDTWDTLRGILGHSGITHAHMGHSVHFLGTPLRLTFDTLRSYLPVTRSHRSVTGMLQGCYRAVK